MNIIISGKQGSGKSTLLRMLQPSKFGRFQDNASQEDLKKLSEQLITKPDIRFCIATQVPFSEIPETIKKKALVIEPGSAIGLHKNLSKVLRLIPKELLRNNP